MLTLPTQSPRLPGYFSGLRPSRPPHLKSSFHHIPWASNIKAEGLRKDLKETTQGLRVCPKRRASDIQSCPHPNQIHSNLILTPTSTHSFSSSMELQPTLKEFCVAKSKIMSLLSRVVLVASNTWTKSTQDKWMGTEKWNPGKADSRGEG